MEFATMVWMVIGFGGRVTPGYFGCEHQTSTAKAMVALRALVQTIEMGYGQNPKASDR